MHSTHLLDLHRATFIENLKACLLLTQENYDTHFSKFWSS